MTTEPKNEDEIARRAHQIWEAEGRPEGRADDHWHRATEQHAAEGGGGARVPSSPASPTRRPGWFPTPRPPRRSRKLPAAGSPSSSTTFPTPTRPPTPRARGTEN